MLVECSKLATHNVFLRCLSDGVMGLYFWTLTDKGFQLISKGGLTKSHLRSQTNND
jgi:hypothetical protein